MLQVVQVVQGSKAKIRTERTFMVRAGYFPGTLYSSEQTKKQTREAGLFFSLKAVIHAHPAISL